MNELSMTNVINTHFNCVPLEKIESHFKNGTVNLFETVSDLKAVANGISMMIFNGVSGVVNLTVSNNNDIIATVSAFKPVYTNSDHDLFTLVIDGQLVRKDFPDVKAIDIVNNYIAGVTYAKDYIDDCVDNNFASMTNFDIDA